MADRGGDEGAEALHRIPVIDKMMEVIQAIESSADEGLTTGEIVASTRIPRSTVYRLLNTLSSHGVLTRTDAGGFRLGFRLVSLAASVRTSFSEAELAAITQPHLDRLAAEIEETCKFSILKDDHAEVISVAQSPNPLAPYSRAGSRFQLHAGAASKLLLANAPATVRERVLAQEHQRFTESTIVDRSGLEAEIKAILTEGVARDRGEWNTSVHAVATPVHDSAGAVAGALSVTYFAVETPAFIERIGANLAATSARISSALGHHGPRTPKLEAALSPPARRARR